MLSKVESPRGVKERTDDKTTAGVQFSVPGYSLKFFVTHHFINEKMKQETVAELDAAVPDSEVITVKSP